MIFHKLSNVLIFINFLPIALMFLTSFFTINFIDKRKLKSKRKSREDLVIHGVVSNKGEKSVSFYYERGLLDFIDHLAKDKGDIVGGNSIFYTKKEYEGVIVEISFKYTEAYNETILGYVNNINTHEGGTHISGFRTVLTRRMNKFGETYNLFGKNNKTIMLILKVQGSDQSALLWKE